MSLLRIVSKLFEKLLLKFIGKRDIIEERNLILSHQFGFANQFGFRNSNKKTIEQVQVTNIIEKDVEEMKNGKSIFLDVRSKHSIRCGIKKT